MLNSPLKRSRADQKTLTRQFLEKTGRAAVQAMDKPEGERSYAATEDAGQLNRNRVFTLNSEFTSFKSKQLVRSQAIRESTSPPRTVSPAALSVEANNETIDDNVKNNDATVNSEQRTLNVTSDAAASDSSSHVSDRCSDVISCSDKITSDYNDERKKKQPVEIQITPGAWDLESQIDQRQRTKRWLGHRHHSDSSRDLLSNNPRVACVCGSCSACPHCRGRRRRHLCPTKQDSGIVCSDECPDCSDSDHTGSNGDRISKTGSLDVDDQPFYCRCPDRKEKPKSISLSKTDSEDRTEPTGLDLVNFIKETLNKNARDRVTLLKIERELNSLVNDTGRCIVRFPVMTSYGRMLVHRCASLFQLSHHLDQTNKNCVLVSKSGTSGGRLPCTNFKQWCTTTFPPSPQRHQPDNMLAKSILKRDAQSLEEGNGGSRAAARSKSLEQREREYERVRRRIFSTDNCAQDETQWPWLSSGPVKLLTPETGRNKLLKVQSLESGGGGGGQGWRSRGAVSKSHSFGGYGGTEPPHPRLLSRQGDLASSSWRLSPSSSGYKTLSLRSTDSVTPSPTGGASPEPMVAGNGFGNGPTVVWAVTDLSSVPPGALVIHPQTGRPLTNPDGSVYRFDPTNPPILYDANIYMQTEHKMDQSCEKRRGRLEKQHSFIDRECECQPSEECRNKCCCECRRHDGCNAKSTSVQEKTLSQTEQSNNVQNPPSPCKNRYESNVEAPPNHNSPTEVATNRVPQNEQTTNQRASVPASPNQRPVYEPTNQNQDISTDQMQYEVNNGQYENQHPPSYEQVTGQKPAYDTATTQRPEHDVTVNHRPKMINQDSQEMAQCVPQQNYPIAFRNEEMTSPPQAMPNQVYIPDISNLQNMMAQAKVTPVPIQDPNLRPMSLTNLVYSAPVASGYPYFNQCRMEPPLQPAVYQPMLQPSEEHKLTPSPHPNEPTFRIDPSYQFAQAEYAASYGSCAPPIHDQTHPAHRGINLSYGPMELPPGGAPMPAAFPLSNVILPQPIHHYPYQEAMPWAGAISTLGTMSAVGAMGAGKVFAAPELCPLVPCAPTAIYPPCGLIYQHPHPQVLPPPYPICQPIYPVLEKPLEQNILRRNSITNSMRQSKRNSISSSSRNTPLETTQDERAVPYENTQSFAAKNAENKQNSNDIAVTIQQIKDQMAQMNSKERDRDKGAPAREKGTDDWKRRNSGNGILGSYPVNNHFNNRLMGRPTNDETQLTSAARAIVNSIRNMQNKNYYQQDRRNNEYIANSNNQPQFQRSISDGYKADREVQRNRQRERVFDNRTQHDRSQNLQPDVVGSGQKMPPAVGNDPSHDRRIEGANRNRNGNPAPFQYRPPYLMRQMSPGTWCRRSPGPVHPVLNHPRRPPPDTRNGRR